MMAQLVVEVQIRKGLGPEMMTKNFDVGFDDLPEETTWSEIKDMARREVESQLMRSEDFPVYGKNWTIVDYHNS
jgi:hypothetical protein